MSRPQLPQCELKWLDVTATEPDLDTARHVMVRGEWMVVIQSTTNKIEEPAPFAMRRQERYATFGRWCARLISFRGKWFHLAGDDQVRLDHPRWYFDLECAKVECEQWLEALDRMLPRETGAVSTDVSAIKSNV